MLLSHSYRLVLGKISDWVKDWTQNTSSSEEPCFTLQRMFKHNYMFRMITFDCFHWFYLFFSSWRSFLWTICSVFSWLSPRSTVTLHRLLNIIRINPPIKCSHPNPITPVSYQYFLFYNPWNADCFSVQTQLQYVTCRMDRNLHMWNLYCTDDVYEPMQFTVRMHQYRSFGRCQFQYLK